MKYVTSVIRSRAAALSRNVLLARWLSDTSVDAADRLAFVPMALDFVMGFRDFNRYYVTYPSPQNELEAALNARAREGETHSALLLQDWASLRMDERLGWAPRDLYWWMTSERTALTRRADFDLTRLAWENPDPLLRFAIVESMEAAGEVFFSRTVPLAQELERRTGRPFPYFGKYRATGHLQHGDEAPFLRAVLSDAQRIQALALVERVFGLFELHFTSWERYARAVEEGRWRYSARDEGRRSATVRRHPVHDVTAYTRLDHPPGLTGIARTLAAERNAAYDALWSARGYRWVREAFPGDFRVMTRYFLLQWIVDNWACGDYFTFDTTYPEASTPLQRGINRLSAHYAAEMKRRYVEWETLQFDEFTGFGLVDALRHYWLGARVEEHRAIFADLRKLTFRYPEPLHRYWILKCFHGFGDTLMRSLGVAMRRSREEDDGFITFAGAPERLHPVLPVDPVADLAIEDLERRRLDASDVAAIRDIIAQTKEQEARRAALTWQIVEEGRYEGMHLRWLVRLRGECKGTAFPSLYDQG